MPKYSDFPESKIPLHLRNSVDTNIGMMESLRHPLVWAYIAAGLIAGGMIGYWIGR